MTAHSSIGASSMHRWSLCPGSVRLSKDLPGTASKYAEEGSDAHALAADGLRRKCNTGWRPGTRMSLEGREFTVTKEMNEAVLEYLDTVFMDIFAGDTLLVEQKFDLGKVHPGLFGTADAVTWKPRTKTLVVDDFKYGAGIPVKVERNPQLMYYGLGALLACNFPAEKVTLRITQPRCDHPDGSVRSWTIDAIDLLDFRADLKAYAEATERADAPLNPGDHCRFCPAAAVCPALGAKRQIVAKQEFAFVEQQPYDPEKLREALDAIPALKAWIKRVDEFAYAEAEAGRPPPGYKLVEKRATRQWADELAAAQVLQDEYLLTSDKIYEPRAVRSVAQIEKVVGKKAMAGLAEHIVKESSGHTLVPLDDKRPAISKTTAKEEFTALSN